MCVYSYAYSMGVFACVCVRACVCACVRAEVQIFKSQTLDLSFGPIVPAACRER